MADTTSVLRNCKVSGEIIARNYAGGIAGMNLGYFFDCQFAGKVQAVKLPDAEQGRGLAGGISGFFATMAYSQPRYGDIKNCSAIDEIISFNTAGGICGYAPPYQKYYGWFFGGTAAGENFSGHFIGENEEILGSG